MFSQLVKKENNNSCACPTRSTYRPSVDIYEEDEAWKISAVMPGVKSEDVELTIEGDQLTIKGKAADSAPEGMKLVYGEYEPHDYSRVFTISEAVDSENISAEMKEGILYITLPKAPEAKPRQITVNAS